VRLNKGLQDLGHLALEGQAIGGDDLGAQTLQADVPAIKEIFYFLLTIRYYLFRFLHIQIKVVNRTEHKPEIYLWLFLQIKDFFVV
jgi:hypothetical protein